MEDLFLINIEEKEKEKINEMRRRRRE